MARVKGLFGFSGNIEPHIAGALDARTVVAEKADLINPTTWQGLDGNSYTYKGMVVSVIDDPIASNNAVYMLKEEDPTVMNNWVAIGSDLEATRQFSTFENYLKNGYFLDKTNPLLGWDFSGSWTQAGIEDYSGAKFGKALCVRLAANDDMTIFSDFSIKPSTEVTQILLHGIVQTNLLPTATIQAGIWESSLGFISDCGAFIKTHAGTPTEFFSVVSLPAEKTNFSFKIEITSDTAPTELYLADVSIIPFISSGTETYTNADPTPIAVGGIAIGTTFSNRTMTQMWNDLLYPELFPTLTAPSSTFTLSITGLREVGEIIPTINVNSTFNRGAITPAYGTSGFRSGLPNTYRYTGSQLSNYSSQALSDSRVISNYSVVLGNQSWTGRVAYDAGEQPLSSKGNPYDGPLPAGMTSEITRTITGVYPFFGTTVTINVLTKQPLSAFNATFFQFSMVAEGGGEKQTAEFSINHSAITGIQFFNTISGQWEWLSGGKANSLLLFTVNTIQKNINGTMVDYKQYVHNGSTIGARQLRFYTT